MKLLICIATVCQLVTLVAAGVEAHPPQTLQTAFDYFTWLKDLVDGGGGAPTPFNSYYDETNLVTECPPNIVFLLDGSDSVSLNGFLIAKDTLIRELRSVTQTFADTHVGVILFSDVTQEISMKARNAAEIELLVNEVNQLVQPRRKTTLSVALKRARQLLLDYSVIESRAYNGARSGNMIVLISDGKADSVRATQQEAKLAKDRNILIASISVEDANIDLLRDISDSVQDYRTPMAWTDLIACPGQIVPPVDRGSACRDFVVVSDGSDSVLQHQSTVRQFLAYTALRYRYVNNAIGVNVYGTEPATEARETRIRPQTDKYTLADMIRLNLVFPTSGGTGTDQAVSQSIGLLEDDLRENPAGLVLITDGPPADPEATRLAVRDARARGYEVVIIRVGTVLTDAALNTMTDGDWTTVHSVPNFRDLFSVNFDGDFCSGQTCNLSPSSCTNGKIFNSNRCACVCPNQCDALRTHDDNCVCQCIDQCPVGTIQDPTSCACRCPNTCPLGFTQRDDCVCVPCPNTCGTNQVYGANCNCQCPNTACPAGQYRGANCACLCSDTGLPPNPVCSPLCSLSALSCNSPHVLNVSQCACVCPNTCSSPFIQDSLTCRCKCPNICNQGFTQASDCSCTPCPYTCANGQLQDSQCACQCRNTCPAGQTLGNDCGCLCTNTGLPPDPITVCDRVQICDLQASDCAFPLVPNTDPTVCRCTCPNTCPGNQAPNPNNQCRCECTRTCPVGFAPDIDQNCACVRTCTNTCPAGQSPDAQNNCVCTCPANSCPPGQSPNPNNNCNCECTNSCPGNLVPLRNQNCQCGCANVCPSGQSPDANNNCQCACNNQCLPGLVATPSTGCLCQCPSSVVCPPSQQPDPNNGCACRCTNSCPAGQVADITLGCACRSICTNTCPRAQTPDPFNNCRCTCDNSCPSGQGQDASCNCFCANQCGVNQIADINQNCACVLNCPNTCPPGISYNDPNTCACTCSDSRYVFNSNTNNCGW